MMNRGTGFIKLTLAGDLPARVGLPPAAGPLSVPQPDQMSAEHLFHPRVEVHDQP